MGTKTRSQIENRGLDPTRDPRSRRRIRLALEMQCMELRLQGRIADGGTGGDGRVGALEKGLLCFVTRVDKMDCSSFIFKEVKVSSKMHN